MYQIKNSHLSIASDGTIHISDESESSSTSDNTMKVTVTPSFCSWDIDEVSIEYGDNREVISGDVIFNSVLDNSSTLSSKISNVCSNMTLFQRKKGCKLTLGDTQDEDDDHHLFHNFIHGCCLSLALYTCSRWNVWRFDERIELDGRITRSDVYLANSPAFISDIDDPILRSLLELHEEFWSVWIGFIPSSCVPLNGRDHIIEESQQESVSELDIMLTRDTQDVPDLSEEVYDNKRIVDEDILPRGSEEYQRHRRASNRDISEGEDISPEDHQGYEGYEQINDTLRYDSNVPKGYEHQQPRRKRSTDVHHDTSEEQQYVRDRQKRSIGVHHDTSESTSEEYEQIDNRQKRSTDVPDEYEQLKYKHNQLKGVSDISESTSEEYEQIDNRQKRSIDVLGDDREYIQTRYNQRKRGISIVTGSGRELDIFLHNTRDQEFKLKPTIDEGIMTSDEDRQLFRSQDIISSVDEYLNCDETEMRPEEIRSIVREELQLINNDASKDDITVHINRVISEIEEHRTNAKVTQQDSQTMIEEVSEQWRREIEGKEQEILELKNISSELIDKNRSLHDKISELEGSIATEREHWAEKLLELEANIVGNKSNEVQQMKEEVQRLNGSILTLFELFKKRMIE